MQALPVYPDYNNDVGINDVLGPWHNQRPAVGQWRHPFHILWVDGQTNKNCPACRYIDRITRVISSDHSCMAD